MDFFKDIRKGENILVLGAGGNTITKQLAEHLSNLKFVAFDLKYVVTPPNTKTENMVTADWGKIPFGDSVFAGVVSVYSFPYWETIDDNLLTNVKDISRCSKAGTRWYFNGRNNESNFFEMIKNHGWEIDEPNVYRSSEDLENNYFAGRAVKKR